MGLYWMNSVTTQGFGVATYTDTVKNYGISGNYITSQADSYLGGSGMVMTAVIHNYRWRLSLAAGEARYDQWEQKLNTFPTIDIPTITVSSDFDGPNKDGKAYAKQFTGKYAHRILNGIGHNVPQEAPNAFADAIIAADKL